MEDIKQEFGECEDSSDDDHRLRIDDDDGFRMKRRRMSDDDMTAGHDAAESLLLLGKERNEPLKDGIYERYIDPSQQKLMLNYYQKMRERNNEASKRCRMKRRLKQESLEKTKQLLEGHREALSDRIAKLQKFKGILNMACRHGDEKGGCQCFKWVEEIKKANREMADFMSLSNGALIAKSRLARDVNIEQIWREDNDELDIPDSVPQTLQKTQSAPANHFVINKAPAALRKTLVPYKGVQTQINPKTGAKTIILNSGSVPMLPVLPGTKTIFLSASNSNVESMPFQMSTSTPNSALRPILPKINSRVTPIPTIKSSQLTARSPITSYREDQPEILIKKEPDNEVIVTIREDQLVGIEPEVLIKQEPLINVTENKQEQQILIKQEPHVEVIAPKEQNVLLKHESENLDGVDPTLTCIAKHSSDIACTQELQDLNSLSQILDLISMKPSSADRTSAAEKAIIKSRLGIEFWKADDSPSYICNSHRKEILENGSRQACSICGKRQSKKAPSQQHMFIITYRMALEFYMTRGNFLAIGHLACANCKVKTLKGLDFSDSITVSCDDLELAIINTQSKEPSKVLQEILEKKVIKEVVGLPVVVVPKVDTIQRLNNVLAGLNPNSEPLKFCSESIGKDTIEATQTAFSTILRAIAPGQEETLWEAVKQGLDQTYSEKL